MKHLLFLLSLGLILHSQEISANEAYNNDHWYFKGFTIDYPFNSENIDGRYKHNKAYDAELKKLAEEKVIPFFSNEAVMTDSRILGISTDGKIDITDNVSLFFMEPNDYCLIRGGHGRYSAQDAKKYGYTFRDYIAVMAETDTPKTKDKNFSFKPGLPVDADIYIAHEMGHAIFSYEQPTIDDVLYDEKKPEEGGYPPELFTLRYRLRYVSTESYAVYVQYLYELQRHKKTDNKSNFVDYITKECTPGMALSLLLFTEVKDNKVTYTYEKLDTIKYLLGFTFPIKDQLDYKEALSIHKQNANILFGKAKWEIGTKYVRDGLSAPDKQEKTGGVWENNKWIEPECSVKNTEGAKAAKIAVSTLLKLVAFNTQMRYGKTGEEEN